MDSHDKEPVNLVEHSFACGANGTAPSSGKSGRRHNRWPKVGRLALVLPGASTTTRRAHQSAYMCGWQCGDLTTTVSKCRGSCPCAWNSDRSYKCTGRLVTTIVSAPLCSTAVGPANHVCPNDSLRKRPSESIRTDASISSGSSSLRSRISA